MYWLSEWKSENINRTQSLSWCSWVDWGICRKSGSWSTTANFLFILLFLSKSLTCCICKVLRRVTYSLGTLHNLYKEHHGNQKYCIALFFSLVELKKRTSHSTVNKRERYEHKEGGSYKCLLQDYSLLELVPLHLWSLNQNWGFISWKSWK